MFGALNFGGQESSSLGLNEFLIDTVGLFVATNLSCLREYVTGAPALPSIIPVLLVLAPGSTIVVYVLRTMQEAGGVPGLKNIDVVTYLFLLGVSYSLGMYIALAYWKPVLMAKGMDESVLEEAKDVRREQLSNVLSSSESSNLGVRH